MDKETWASVMPDGRHVPADNSLDAQWRIGGMEVHQVGGAAGGECYLVRLDEGGSYLVDAGFAWSAPQTLENIRAVLGPEGQVDWILLTHSHYDHVAGAGYLVEHMPNTQVACSPYAAHVFERPGALAVMNELNDSAAREAGVEDFQRVPEHIRVDRVVDAGDMIELRGARLEVVPAVGHTKCSIAFWDADRRMLVSSETAGCFAGPLPQGFVDVDGEPAPGEVQFMTDPAYLVGYQSSLDFIAHARDLAPDLLLVPHYGIMAGREAEDFLVSADYFSRYAADLICAGYDSGLTNEEVTAQFKDMFQNDYVRSIQPDAAFDTNARYIIPLVLRELRA